MRGALDVEDGGILRGWVMDGHAEATLAVEILIDGTRYWAGRADRLEHPQFDTSMPRRRCGIRLSLPMPVRRPQVVAIALVAGGDRIAETTADLSSRYAGSIDQVETGPRGITVRGWVHDKSRYLEAVHIEVHGGGSVLGTGRANLYRDDLDALKVGRGRHAFRLHIDALPARIPPTSLRVVIAGTAIELPAHPAAFLPPQTGSSPQRGMPLVDADGGAVRLRLRQPPTANIIGTCDRISGREVSGWALDKDQPGRPVVVDLMFNNITVASTTTDRARRDVSARHGGDGFAGFALELPPQAWLGRHVRVAVVSRKSGATIERGAFVIKPGFTHALPSAPGHAAGLLTRYVVDPHRHGRETTPQPRVSLIILNKNGAELLERHFQTFAKFNRYPDVETLVVDHGSSDESEATVERWQKQGLAVRWLPRGGNYSFSASNNYAAELAAPGALVFVNNDVFFSADILADVVQALYHPGIGIAGIRLLDERVTDDDFAERAVQHLGVHFNTCRLDRAVHPVESRYGPQFVDVSRQTFLVPSVTGAFLAIKKDDFARVGGFCEEYFYGYEDIDLCLKVKFELGKEIVLAGQSEAIHYRGYSRKQSDAWSGSSMERNRRMMADRFGLKMRRTLRDSLLANHAYWTAVRPIIAFAVTKAAEDTTAGDFFTAYEMAQALSALVDADIVFLEENVNWYDVHDIDMLVVMTHNYRLGDMKEPKQNLITVGWARNWFAEWTTHPATACDILFSSSVESARMINATLGHPEHVLRIATNVSRFHEGEDQSRDIDYAFTGSFWGHSREIIYLLDPAGLPYSCAIFGSGWDAFPHLAPYSRGPVPYDDLGALYRQIKVVIDDANSVTKEWGSANSRIFDALASGALVICNSPQVSEDAFGGMLPTFTTTEELEALLHRFCSSETERRAVLGPLQAYVLQNHTYARRARELVQVVRQTLPKMLRIALKVPCPREEEANAWGDYHLAKSLAKELRRLGHSVRIDFLPNWQTPRRLRDDVSICLRGLSTYRPVNDQINILWLISHPDTVSIAELEQYDRVYVASAHFAAHLRAQGLTNIEVMLQCVDTDLFQADATLQKEYDVLFVGNSRGVFRSAVRAALQSGIDLTIVGAGWEGFVSSDRILTEYIPNEALAKLYGSARVVLNDHWDSMRDAGFISNRLFDCVAAGAHVVSDAVAGIGELFGPLVDTYDDVADIRPTIERALAAGNAARDHEATRRHIIDEHSVRARAKVIGDFISGEYEAICNRRAQAPADFAGETSGSVANPSI